MVGLSRAILPVCLVLAGCANVPPLPRASAVAAFGHAEVAARSAASDSPRLIDLSGGQPPAPGFGRLVVDLRHRDVFDRRVQAALPQNAILVVTRPGGGEVTDQDNNPAIYTAPIVAGVSTIVLPGLPSTTTEISGAITPTSYVLDVLLGTWEPFVPPSSYGDLTVAPLAYGVETTPGVTFGFTPQKFSGDLLELGDDPSAPANVRYLVASGWTRASVSAGLKPSIATVTTGTHLRYRLINSAAFLATDEVPGSPEHRAQIDKGVYNTSVLQNLRSDSSGQLRLRHPGLNPDEIDLSTDPLTTIDGATRSNKRVLRMQVQLTGATTFSSPPALTAWTYDPAAASTSSVAPDVSALPLDLYAPTAQNPGFDLANQLAFGDLDFSAAQVDSTSMELLDLTPGEFNIVDLVLTGLPPNAALNLWLVPLGTYLITSGPYAPTQVR